MDKTFNDWLDEIECYSTRYERFYDSVAQFKTKEGLVASLLLWLEAAYNQGKQDAHEEKSKDSRYDSQA
jgi:hypothetical protein